jgi:hypothetical protein
MATNMNRRTLRTLARLVAPWRTIRRLEQDNRRLMDALSNPELTGMALEQNAMTMGMRGRGPQLIAGMFLGLLDENPEAVNYLELTFGSSRGRILVTVHRPGGATPHNLRAMAEQEARNLRAELAEARQGAEYLRGDLATAREAVRRLVRWGLEGYDTETISGVYNWFIINAMAGPLLPLPKGIAKREAKAAQAKADPPEAHC